MNRYLSLIINTLLSAGILWQAWRLVEVMGPDRLLSWLLGAQIVALWGVWVWVFWPMLRK